MNILFMASSLRTAGNLHPVLEAMRSRGDRVTLAWVPLGAAVDEDPSALGFTEIIATNDGERTESASTPFWLRLVAKMREQRFPLVIMDDMIHWPARRMAETVANGDAVHPRPSLVASQHGLYQAWNLMNQRFLADYFLCYGHRHVLNFDQCHWTRVLPTGLPKLDHLRRCAEGAGQYILFVAQSAPSPAVIAPVLLDLERLTGLPVRIRPHPGHRTAYAGLSDEFRFVSTDEPIEGQIALSDWVLTTHSSAVLEAMRMGKPVVLLPSFGLVDFGFFPGIAVDFRADKVLSALKVHRSDAAGRTRFLAAHCGGTRSDAGVRTLAALDAIVRGDGALQLVASMGLEHPLNFVLADQHHSITGPQ